MQSLDDIGLNLAQQDAVHYVQGPCLVLAGAGSGKTRVIAHKIAHLVQSGLAPERIAAITFTNKAAAEMRERSKALLGRKSKGLSVSTFHSLGMRILREDGTALGLKQSFSILDSDDVLSLLKEAGGSTDKSQARQWQWCISRWKNEGKNAQDALQEAADEEERAAAIIMQRYQERLMAFQAVDFDDLIELPLRLLQTQSEVCEKWQQRLDHVLVDEYQDTNVLQYELLKLLTGAPARFTAVGDDDQSIYGWRGASLDNLKRLPQDFPQLKVIKLEQNYRSTNSILQAANQLIGNNPKLFEKKLWSGLGPGEPVRVVAADNEEHEAERAVARIQSLRSTSQHNEWRDYAILYRANHQSRAFEQALRKAQIPYKVSGGIGFFARAEIKDLCAWMRLLSNNDDDPAFLRAITTPKRGVGHQTLQHLGNFASSYKLSLFQALFSPMLAHAVSTRALDHLHEFGRYVNDLEYRARHTIGAEDSLKFLHEWLQAIDYQMHLEEGQDSPKLAQARYSNVLDFCDWVAGRAGGDMEEVAGVQMSTPSISLLEVVQGVSLLSSLSEKADEQNAVTLSTLHAAKGLEWAHVVLAGINEGLLPFAREAEGGVDNLDANRLEEERRLMYVGITRARWSLLVSYCKQRKRGRGTMGAAQASRFIAEMALDKATVQEDPRAKLKALRAEFALREQAAL